MSLMAEKPKSNVPIFPAGTHHAVCYSIVDLGTQVGDYMGRPKSQWKIRIGWEFPQVRIDYEVDGKMKNVPRVYSKEYTLSLHEKANLTKDIIAWRGKLFTLEEWSGGFDVFNMIGENCLIQIVHKANQLGTKTYANVASVAQLMSGMKPVAPESEIVRFSIREDGITNIPENKLPDWLVDKIKQSVEYKAVQRAANNPDLQAAQAGSYKDSNLPESEQIPDEPELCPDCGRSGVNCECAAF